MTEIFPARTRDLIAWSGRKTVKIGHPSFFLSRSAFFALLFVRCCPLDPFALPPFMSATAPIFIEPLLNKPDALLATLPAEGTPIWAFRGEDRESSEFRLGTREYDWHSHIGGHLFCIDSGLLHIQTRRGAWLLPPHRAGWIPPGLEHRARISGVVSGWAVLISPSAAVRLPTEPCVMGVTNLLAALVERAMQWELGQTLTDEDRRLAMVLLDEVERAPVERLGLPMPVDVRAERIAQSVMARFDTHTPLETLSSEAGLSARTARRVFQAETGMSFVQWRQQARLVMALELLARGDPVAAVADALGYATPSNFIAMFRRAFGEPPARYFRTNGRVAVVSG